MHTDSTDLMFNPPTWLKHGLIQTFVAGSKFRRPDIANLEAASEEWLINCQDAKLQAYISTHSNPVGSAVVIHGWEGSHNSTYVRSTSAYLFSKGYTVIRLNMRDHGDTHHLNEGVFHSNLLDEVLEAVTRCFNLNSSLPSVLIGFSLGGNFALRIARELAVRRHSQPLEIFAISPVIDPWAASPKVDENPLIRKYFLKKWKSSLLKKQACYPDLYDFSDILNAKYVMDISDQFLPKYTPFETSREYFNSYRIWPDDLKDCDIPTKIITSRDDPIIPIDHLFELNLSPCVERIILKYGGHNGFFQSLNGPTWYEEYIWKTLSK